jgi:glucose dehydrogenase
MAQHLIFVGIRGTVLALDSTSGSEIWRTSLKGADFVNVVLLGSTLFASANGEVFAVDPTTGQILWQNKLTGLGMGFVTFAGAGQVPPSMASRKRQQTAAAG